MIDLKDALTSSIGKKILNGLTAVGLVVFIVVHLGGNLTLLGGPEAFNGYADKTHSLGVLLYIIEAGLFAVILFHVGSGIAVAVKNAGARSEGYRDRQTSKGGPSNYGLSSVNMILSGLILLMFIVIHLLQFRFRDYLQPGYVEELGQIAGVSDATYHDVLFGLVACEFQDPVWVVVYCGVMLFLGLHLRHGIWSMFQSLGAMNRRWKRTVYGIAFVLGALLAVGFFFLPIGIYFEWLPHTGEALQCP